MEVECLDGTFPSAQECNLEENKTAHAPLQKEQDSQDMIKKGLEKMEAVLVKLSNHIKKAYFEAIDLEPNLVAQETPLLFFLRTENYNHEAAAKRVAQYWKYRKEMFGERWLLPMNQTGKGALSMDDVELLRRGYLMTFHVPDEGAVVVQDHSRLPVWNETVERAVFYWVYLFGSEAIQTKGVRFVNAISSAPSPVISVQNKSWHLILSAMPIKMKGMLVVQSYEEGRQALIDYKAYQTTQLLRHARAWNVEHLAAGSARDNLRLLEERGVHPNFVPPCLGGKYDYRQFDKFVRQRLSVEEIMSSAPPVLNASLWRRNKKHAVGRQANATSAALAACKPRKRKVVEISERSAVYSRRYNHRKRLKEITLMDEHKLLVEQNQKLLSENRHLRCLVGQALTIVNCFKS